MRHASTFVRKPKQADSQRCKVEQGLPGLEGGERRRLSEDTHFSYKMGSFLDMCCPTQGSETLPQMCIWAERVEVECFPYQK